MRMLITVAALGLSVLSANIASAQTNRYERGYASSQRYHGNYYRGNGMPSFNDPKVWGRQGP
jgi:hypothetical protein